MNRQEIEKEIIKHRGLANGQAKKIADILYPIFITKQIELLEQVPTDSYSLCIFLEETINNLKKELE